MHLEGVGEVVRERGRGGEGRAKERLRDEVRRSHIAFEIDECVLIIVA